MFRRPNMVSSTCESTLLDANTSVLRRVLLDSPPYRTAPSNRPLAYSPAAPVKRSKETLGTDNVPQSADDSILLTTRSFQNDHFSPALHRQFPLYWSADCCPPRSYSIEPWTLRSQSKIAVLPILLWCSIQEGQGFLTLLP